MAGDETTGNGSASTGSASTGIAPWLPVPDAPRAVQWYADALGATAGYTLPGDDGRAVVARLAVDGADFWVAEEPAPEASGARPGIRLILTVADPRALFDRAVAAGATTVAAVHEEHGWLVGRLADPFGYHWEVGRPFPEADAG